MTPKSQWGVNALLEVLPNGMESPIQFTFCGVEACATGISKIKIESVNEVMQSPLSPVSMME